MQPDPIYYQQLRAPARSAIPKVMGILMIIFASLGLFGGLFGLLSSVANDALFREIPQYKTWHTIELLLNVTGLAIGALHLYTGVRAVGYKRNAPSFAVTYAITAMVVTLINAILVFAWIKPALEKSLGEFGGDVGAVFGPIMVFSTLIALAWPTLVLILMTRPAAKAACVNEL